MQTSDVGFQISCHERTATAITEPPAAETAGLAPIGSPCEMPRSASGASTRDIWKMISASLCQQLALHDHEGQEQSYSNSALGPKKNQRRAATAPIGEAVTLRALWTRRSCAECSHMKAGMLTINRPPERKTRRISPSAASGRTLWWHNTSALTTASNSPVANGSSLTEPIADSAHRRLTTRTRSRRKIAIAANEHEIRPLRGHFFEKPTRPAPGVKHLSTNKGQRFKQSRVEGLRYHQKPLFDRVHKFVFGWLHNLHKHILARFRKPCERRPPTRPQRPGRLFQARRRQREWGYFYRGFRFRCFIFRAKCLSLAMLVDQERCVPQFGDLHFAPYGGRNRDFLNCSAVLDA